MVSVIYTHRLVCDCSFISWLLKQADKHPLFSKLIHIKSSSEQWKKVHNVILSSEFKKNKSELNIDEKTVGAIFKIIEDPDSTKNYKDQKTKNLIYSIDLTDERPFKSYFLTSPENEEEYKNNKHFQGITSSVRISSGNDAREIIEDFFLAFETKREESR